MRALSEKPPPFAWAVGAGQDAELRALADGAGARGAASDPVVPLEVLEVMGRVVRLRRPDGAVLESRVSRGAAALLDPGHEVWALDPSAGRR